MSLISIVMSVYNGERFLSQAIESILNQTFKEFEFIVIDDGSSDKSVEIIVKYAQRDPRIVFIRNNRNLGLTASINKGISISKGKFIARQDADDISLSNRLECQLNFLEKNNDFGLAGTAFFEIDENSRIICKQRTPLLTNDTEIRKSIVKFNPFCHSSVMFRRESIDKVGLYNEKYLFTQDYELWVRLMKHYKVANLKEALLHKRKFSKMISISKLQKQSFYAIKAKMFTIKLLDLPTYNYLYILKDIIRFISPPVLVELLRSVKLRLTEKYEIN